MFTCLSNSQFVRTVKLLDVSVCISQPQHRTVQVSNPSILVRKQDVSMARNCLDSYLVAPGHQSIQDRDHPVAIIDTQISTIVQSATFP